MVGNKIKFIYGKSLKKGVIAHIDNMFTVCDNAGKIYYINLDNIKYVFKIKKLCLSIDDELVALNYSLIDKGHGIIERAFTILNNNLKIKNKK